MRVGLLYQRAGTGIAVTAAVEQIVAADRLAPTVEYILGFGYLVDESGRHLCHPPRSRPRHERPGVEAMFVATAQREIFAREVMPALCRP